VIGGTTRNKGRDLRIVSLESNACLNTLEERGEIIMHMCGFVVVYVVWI